MPLPKPQKDQTKEEFIDMCMMNPIMNDEYSSNKQRYAVCNSLYEQAKRRKSQGNIDVVDFAENHVGQDVIIL